MKKPGWKVALLIVAVLWIGAGTALAAEKVTVYGDDGYPPYSYGEGGVPKGVYVDILKEAFAKMPDYEVEIKVVPWKRMLGQLEAGDIFAGFPPYASKNRP